MTARPWMPFYVADFLADTEHLDAAQTGAYLRLIMHYWQHGGLPFNDAALMRIARMTPAQWRRDRAIIAAFFHDGWKHKRVDEEIAEAAAKTSKKSEAGKEGAEKRWQGHGKPNSKPMAHPSETGWQNDGSRARASPSQSPEGSEDKSSGARAPLTLDPKTLLFRDGLTTLAKISGRKPEAIRSLIGRWMKLTGDDAGALLAEIARCRDSPVADPITSIEARLKPRDPNGKPRRITNAEQSAAAMAWALDRVNGGNGGEAEPAEPDYGDTADGGGSRAAPAQGSLGIGDRTG